MRLTTVLKRPIGAVCLLAIGLPGGAWAQDLLRSTGSSARSYNYVEAQYLVNVDLDAPIFATAQVAIDDHYSLIAAFNKVDESGQEQGVSVTIEATEISLGIAYHDLLSALPDTDWVVALSYGQVDFAIDASNDVNSVSVSDKEDFFEAYAGLRRSISDRLEAEAGLSMVYLDGDTTGSGDLTLVYRVAERLDLALGLNGVTEEDTVGIGLRLTW